MPVDTEDEVKEEISREEMDKLREEAEREDEERAERQYMKDVRETARIKRGELEAQAAQRKREEQEKRDRGAYNQSWKGWGLNQFGWGKYQRKDRREQKESGAPIDPTRMPSTGPGGKTDGMTKTIIILAFIIWMIDLIDFARPPEWTILSINLLGFLKIFSFLGGPYTGFNFDLFGILRTNWLVIISSSVMLFFLLAKIFTGTFERDPKLLLYISGAYLLLWYWGRWNIEIPYGNIIVLTILGLMTLYAFLMKGGFTDDVTYLLMAAFLSFFWINWGWYAFWKARIHVFFILFFGFFYMAIREKEPFAWHIAIPALMFFDFYAYSLSSKWDLLAKVPFLTMMIIAYCLYRTRTTFPGVSALVVTLIFLIFAFQGPSNVEAAPTTIFTESTEPGAPGATSKFSEFITKLKALTIGGVESELDKATGGYYRSKVEQNQFETLGVYLEKVRAAQPKFYTTEPVTLWSTIKSRTLSDPVIAYFTCYRWRETNKIPVAKDDTVIPDTPFAVFTLEEKDVECTFKQSERENKLPAGTNTVTLYAEYNFETSAYKKFYLIDRDRFRSKVSEDSNEEKILKEFGQTDTKPFTRYTNGPVDIDVRVTNLMPVANDIDVKPSITITLRNRNKITDKNGKTLGEWQGKILNVRELIILLPNGITMDKPGECTPVEFKQIQISDVNNYCSSSCDKAIKEPCSERCNKASEISKDKGTVCQQKCSKILLEFSDSIKKCNEECKNLFRGEGTTRNYNGYSAANVAKLSIPRTSDPKEFDRNKEFNCRIYPTTTALDDVPVTPRYIRVVARYDYILEQSYAVTIAPAPGTIGGDVSNVVSQYAKEYQIDPVLLQAIIYVETGGKANHCNDGSTKCSPDQVVTSSRGSVGIMQINVAEKGGVPKWKTDALEICGRHPDGTIKTVYDIDCNIKLGAYILRQKYDAHAANGASASVLAEYCPQGEPFHERYKSYRGWDAALRGYNGWGCKAGADVNYVQKVRDAEKAIKNRLINSQVLAKLGVVEQATEPQPTPTELT